MSEDRRLYGVIAFSPDGRRDGPRLSVFVRSTASK